VRGPLPPLEGALDTLDVLRLAGELAAAQLTVGELYLLELSGLGRQADALLRATAHSPLVPIFQGERGSGKEWVAQLAHRLSGARGHFRVVRPGDDPVVRSGSPGTVYLENIEQHPADHVEAMRALTRATGWKLMAGTRHEPTGALTGDGWTTLTLRPLRERVPDIRPLFRLYLGDWCKRLGLPRMRIAKKLWTMLEQHDWPGNNRELETFAVQAATATQGMTLNPDSLPIRVRALLDPVAQSQLRRQSYETVVEDQLRPIVADYVAMDGAPSLHRLVVDATERALIRLALNRAGNQKAAAILLGVARNTLRERMARLQPHQEGE